MLIKQVFEQMLRMNELLHTLPKKMPANSKIPFAFESNFFQKQVEILNVYGVVLRGTHKHRPYGDHCSWTCLGPLYAAFISVQNTVRSTIAAIGYAPLCYLYTKSDRFGRNWCQFLARNHYERWSSFLPKWVMLNKHNCRIYATENPQMVHEEPLYDQKVTVWCGVCAALRLRWVIKENGGHLKDIVFRNWTKVISFDWIKWIMSLY